jgi:hypothetical protein
LQPGGNVRRLAHDRVRCPVLPAADFPYNDQPCVNADAHLERAGEMEVRRQRKGLDSGDNA